MPDFTHLVLRPEKFPGSTKRVEAMALEIMPFVSRRLAMSWGQGCYRDFRDGKTRPVDVAAESPEGLAEVLAYIKRVGPSIKGTDWANSGWVGKGRKKPVK